VIFHEKILPYRYISVTNGLPIFPTPNSYRYPDPGGFSDSFPATNAEHVQDTISSSPISTPDGNSSSQPTRRSNWPHKTPTYLSEYVCSNVITDSSKQFSCPNTVTSLCCNVTSVDRDSLPSQATVLFQHLDSYKEPSSYEEAYTKPEWQEAMNKEFEALQANNTWELVPLRAGKKPISCK